MTMPGESPDKAAVLSDASEKKLAEWMVKQQNRVDDELKDIREIVGKIDKQVAVESVKADEAHKRFDEFKLDHKAELKELKTSINSLKTTIAWAGGAAAMLAFILGIAVTMFRIFMVS